MEESVKQSTDQQKEIQKAIIKEIVNVKNLNSSISDPEKETINEESQVVRREKAEIDESNVNFSQNRDLWQRRANIEAASSPLMKSQRLSEPFVHRQSHTPDLVMDLPLASSVSVFSNLCLSGSPEDSANTEKPQGDVESPEMTTAAETFAKQNQCTLKKNTKIQLDDTEFMTITSPVPNRKYATLGASSTSTSTFKPPTKTKPMVLKKPVFSVPLRSVSIEMVCNKEELPP